MRRGKLCPPPPLNYLRGNGAPVSQLPNAFLTQKKGQYFCYKQVKNKGKSLCIIIAMTQSVFHCIYHQKYSYFYWGILSSKHFYTNLDLGLLSEKFVQWAQHFDELKLARTPPPLFYMLKYAICVIFSSYFGCLFMVKNFLGILFISNKQLDSKRTFQTTACH